MLRRALIVSMSGLLVGACATTTPSAQTQATIEPPTLQRVIVAPKLRPKRPAPTEPLTVIAVGDIMLGTDYPDDNLPPEDGATSFSGVADILQEGNLTFGNLEGVLMDGGSPEKMCRNISLCYLFRSPSRYADHLAQAGFNLISLANNHARDFGEHGRSMTMHHLNRVGIAHAGRKGDVASLRYGDYKIAMIAFSPNIDSYNINEIDIAESLISDLSKRHDITIVSFHGGAEGPDALHVTNVKEKYYGEERGNVVEFSHRVIDAGADLVIGHGPHVPRGLELYRKRLIAYSLGNFNTYFGISIKELKGLAPILKVQLGHDGSFLAGRIISTRQYRPGGPQLDDTQEAMHLMRTLSIEDFGASAPIIDDNGLIMEAVH